MKKTIIVLLLVLIAAAGCMRKDIMKTMQERTHENWMMISEDLRIGDSARYCLSEYTGGKKKLSDQCRQWTVTGKDKDTVTLKLVIINGPPSLDDIERTYVVDKGGFIQEATALSTKSGKKVRIRIAGKLEGLSFDRKVPVREFLSDDLEIIDKYTYKNAGRWYMKSGEYGHLEVVPVKVLLTPTKKYERFKYYLTSNIAEFGYLIEINVKKHQEDRDKDILWVNKLKNTKKNVTAPLP